MIKEAYINGFMYGVKQASPFDDALTYGGIGALAGGLPSAVYGYFSDDKNPWTSAAKYGLGGAALGAGIGGAGGYISGQQKELGLKDRKLENYAQKILRAENENIALSDRISDFSEKADNLKKHLKDVKDSYSKSMRFNSSRAQQAKDAFSELQKKFDMTKGNMNKFRDIRDSIKSYMDLLADPKKLNDPKYRDNILEAIRKELRK